MADVRVGYLPLEGRNVVIYSTQRAVLAAAAPALGAGATSESSSSSKSSSTGVQCGPCTTSEVPVAQAAQAKRRVFLFGACCEETSAGVMACPSVREVWTAGAVCSGWLFYARWG